jgi:hypothetical protein
MEDPEGLETVVDGNKITLRVSTKKKSDSMLLRSEIREDLSRIRARVSSMLMKSSDVKSARPVRNN